MIAPRHALALAATAGLLLLPAAAGAECPDANLEATPDTIVAVRAAVLCVVNERRAEAGVALLRRSPYLVESATAHSDDMVVHHYLAHQGDGRPSLYARIFDSGYFRGATDALYSENIGVMPRGAATARILVNAWMRSPTHRANLVHPSFHDLGVGTAFAAPDPTFYPDYPALVVTSDFGTRRIGAGRPGPRCHARHKAGTSDASATDRRRYCRRLRGKRPDTQSN